MDTPQGCPECGRPYRPNQVLVGFYRCTCPAGVPAGGGHISYGCRWCGHVQAPGHEGPVDDRIQDFLLLSAG